MNTIECSRDSKRREGPPPFLKMPRPLRPRGMDLSRKPEEVLLALDVCGFRRLYKDRRGKFGTKSEGEWPCTV